MGDGARELAWRGIAAELRGFRVGGAEQLAAGRDIGVAVCVAAGVGRAAGRSGKNSRQGNHGDPDRRAAPESGA